MHFTTYRVSIKAIKNQSLAGDLNLYPSLDLAPLPYQNTQNLVLPDRVLMSPFGQVLHDLRQRYGLRQTELAERMGYEQSYLSALELGVKGPPPEAFLKRLVMVLSLDEDAEEAIYRAADDSNRRFTIPVDSPRNVYETCNELRRQLDRLHPSQIDLIQRILRMPQELSIKTSAEPQRIKRRTRLHNDKEK